MNYANPFGIMEFMMKVKVILGAWAAIVGLGILGAHTMPHPPVLHGAAEASAGHLVVHQVHLTRAQLRGTHYPLHKSSSSHHRLLRGYVAWRLARFGIRHFVFHRRFHLLPWWMRR